jgi:hypothetical protein
MIRRNIDVSKGIVNGTMGKVDQFVCDKSGAVLEIYVKVQDREEEQPIVIKRVSTEYLVSSFVVDWLKLIVCNTV